jgi:hydrogenase maturation protein HypF
VAAVLESPPQVRRYLRVRGQVQGVGFRPFVFRLAGELQLQGWVRNDADGVHIEIQGPVRRAEEFRRRLSAEAPALSRISAVEESGLPVEPGEPAFRILASRGGTMLAEAAPDVGTCPDCLAELFDPADRRHRYAFINCTQCGPRYTIIRNLPYDRPQTSMAAFAQCPACLAEYRDPAHRRFHAEPNACPACGPSLWLCDAAGARQPAGDVIAESLDRLQRGEILAIKGLGGFHLACDARNGAAVARLRARKNREEKPFAVMLAGSVSLEEFVDADPDSLRALESPERPIVLMRKRAGCDALVPGVAPGLEWLGLMLPYTPLQYLLFHEAAGRPQGIDWMARPQPLALVMTSANPGGEPLVIGNEEALARLAGIADAFVMHDREIVTRCDDSVVRSQESGVRSQELWDTDRRGYALPLAPDSSLLTAPVQFIRRARGFTPRAIRLAGPVPQVLACGAFLKNTVCFTRGDQAFLSQHIGDLDNAATCRALEEAVERLSDLLQVVPQAVACDLHPDFHSSRYAAELARARGVPLIAVQHHHAHIAAVIAEHGIEDEVLGIALDGVGLGSDGAAWGGELLRVSVDGFDRVGHLRELRLPGGDRAAREPWRMAAAALHALDRTDEIAARFAYPAAKALPVMLRNGAHAPLTTSCGRWFDAAAGLAGIKDHAAFEGQAAMLYEGLAGRHGPVPPLADGYAVGADGVLDLLPLIRTLADEKDIGYAAALFHATLAAALADWAGEAARAAGLRRVALGGGCFLNRILSARLRELLVTRGLEVFEARQAPPNDGGLSLGQAWVAARSLQRS